jgi:hydrogenase expression/formation protein HypC
MCLAVPALVRSISGSVGEVEVGGVRRKISLHLVPEAKVGDYVYVHTGFAISIVDEEEAKETLQFFRELLKSYDEEELFLKAGDRQSGFG